MAAAVAAARPRISNFSRNTLSTSYTLLPAGVRTGPNSTAFASSGIPTLDEIWGGGYCLGSLIMVMEDPEVPHHMLLLRSFMSQGVVHDQPLLLASPMEDPRRFLDTLPSPTCSTADKSPRCNPEEDMRLRIAWQYKKYFDENHHTFNSIKDNEIEYCGEFDLRKPLQRQFIAGRKIECISIQKNSDLAAFHDQCGIFLNQHARKECSTFGACRIAIQSFCALQCEYFDQVSVNEDDHKDLAKLLTEDYLDIVGLLNIHKIARPNIQVLISTNDSMHVEGNTRVCSLK